MERKVPMRTCVGCGVSKPKQELIRILKRPEGGICLDETGRMNGRGAYLCSDPKCLEAAVKKKSLARAFRTEVSEDDLDALREEIIAHA
ncbi:MAG: YlxR family protein [Lachnospiraceae bacterium]|nr:YlxR family protein [Lachnospiraceae bacterium]